MRLRGEPRIVGDEHLRLQLDAQGGATPEAIAFRQAEEAEWLRNSSSVDLAFRLRSRSWQGVEYLQAQVVSLRPGEPAWAASES